MKQNEGRMREGEPKTKTHSTHDCLPRYYYSWEGLIAWFFDSFLNWYEWPRVPHIHKSDNDSDNGNDSDSDGDNNKHQTLNMHACRHFLAGEVATQKERICHWMKGIATFRTIKLFYSPKKWTNKWIPNFDGNSPPAKRTRTVSNRCIELLDKCDSDSINGWMPMKNHYSSDRSYPAMKNALVFYSSTNQCHSKLEINDPFCSGCAHSFFYNEFQNWPEICKWKNSLERKTCIEMVVRRNKKYGHGVVVWAPACRSEKKIEARRTQLKAIWIILERVLAPLFYDSITMHIYLNEQHKSMWINVCLIKKNIFGKVVGFSDQCTQECLHKHKLTHTHTTNKARNVSMDQSNNTKNNHRKHLAQTRTTQTNSGTKTKMRNWVRVEEGSVQIKIWFKNELHKNNNHKSTFIDGSIVKQSS